MNFKSVKILTTLILSGLLFLGCGGGDDSRTTAPTTPTSTDSAAPVFSSAVVAGDFTRR